MTDVLQTLLTRRSSKPALMQEPGPSNDELEQILTAAMRVPDHKKLTPWRFITLTGDAREAFGHAACGVLETESSEPISDVRRQTERERLMRAPCVVVAIAAPHRTEVVPEREQILSAGAACFNLCLAANALGYGTAWLTEWLSYSDGIAKVLQLADHEVVAGFIYIGTVTEAQPDRDRPRVSERWSAWQ
ncbi:MAG: nitroreductase [Pseudomonadota bacterium]